MSTVDFDDWQNGKREKLISLTLNDCIQFIQMGPICHWFLLPNPVICWVERLSISADHVSIHGNASYANSIPKVWKVSLSTRIERFVCSHSFSLRDISGLKLPSARNHSNGKDVILSVSTIAVVHWTHWTLCVSAVSRQCFLCCILLCSKFLDAEYALFDWLSQLFHLLLSFARWCVCVAQQKLRRLRPTGYSSAAMLCMRETPLKYK